MHCIGAVIGCVRLREPRLQSRNVCWLVKGTVPSVFIWFLLLLACRSGVSQEGHTADLSTGCYRCVSDRLSGGRRGLANRATSQQQCTLYRMATGLNTVPLGGCHCFYVGLHVASMMVRCSSSKIKSSSMHSMNNMEHACSNT